MNRALATWLRRVADWLDAPKEPELPVWARALEPPQIPLGAGSRYYIERLKSISRDES